MTFVAYVVFVLMLAFIGWYLGREHRVVRYFALTFALFYGLRATILLAHWDTVEPVEFFNTQFGGSTLTEALWLIVVFLGSVTLGYGTSVGAQRIRVPVFVVRPLSVRRMTIFTIL